MSETTESDFSDREIEEIETQSAVRPPVVFEVIRRDGEEEMARPSSALALSGIAAGMAIGLSLLSEALLRVYLPDAPWRPLVENIGYTVGFMIVILGQMQLFTENTITPVSTVLGTPTRVMALNLLRVWSVVLLANVVGCIFFALGARFGGAVDPATLTAMISISEHAMSYSFGETVVRGVVAGWLLAALVWLIASALGGANVIIVFIMTYLIALGDFSHVIAGSAEAAFLVFDGRLGLLEAVFGFFVPALIGNVIGGSGLFTVLVWGQIKADDYR